MTEQELRALVRDAIARQAGKSRTLSPAAAQVAFRQEHASHALFPLPAGADADGPCLIEPAVMCNHCGYCKSMGHWVSRRSKGYKVGTMRRSMFVAAAFAVLLASRTQATDRVAGRGGVILITPLVHASVQIEHRGTVVQVDPWSLGDLSEAKRADLILISDDPAHHLDVKAIQQLRKPGAPVVIPASGKGKVADGLVMANGERKAVAGVVVEALPAYDIKPGNPVHPKGEANGYLLTLGGNRILLAGVTECVPEVLGLRDIDIAFMPMNIPPGRMTPAAAADCVKAIKPRVVYLYHYNQDYAANLANPAAPPQQTPGLGADLGVRAFIDALKGTGIEVKRGAWYPKRVK